MAFDGYFYADTPNVKGYMDIISTERFPALYEKVKDFFQQDPEAARALDAGDIENLYLEWQAHEVKSSSAQKASATTLTCILYKAGIDILTYGELVPARAFAYLPIREANIPENIKYIGAEVFKECMHLKTVSLPHSLKAIHEFAFYNTYGLKTIKYAGTRDEFEDLMKHSDIRAFKNMGLIGEAPMVSCSDGDLFPWD